MWTRVSCLLSGSTGTGQSPQQASGRRRPLGLDAGEPEREPPQRSRQLVVVVERERPALVQRVKGATVIARKCLHDLTSDRPLDLVWTDVGLPIGSTDDDGDSIAPIALAEDRGHPTRAPDRRELLIGDDHNRARAIKRVESNAVG